MYHTGIGYFISSDLAAPFFNASFYTNFLRLEDAFTGLLAKRVKVNYVDINGLYIFKPEKALERASGLNKTTNRLLFSNTDSLDLFLKIWNIFYNLSSL